MKIISKIRRFFDHLLDYESKDDVMAPPIDTPVDIIHSIEDVIEDEQSLNVPPPLETKIITPEQTAPLVMDENVQISTEAENRCDFSDKDLITDVALTHSTDNAQFVKLLENICLAMEDFDKKSDNLAKQSGEKVYKFIRSKLIDRICISGASIIKDEDVFDLLRHYPIETTEVPEEGHNIESTVKPGVEFEGKVYLRAIVKLKN